ncbi:hypothetical protein B447_17586 [Thauera sp. 27]|uniref:hypothetical protein n=1 Tax=Thauera sp. 27 TaxID=305700 RepID=UPI0002CFC855|nr:hypothetical protein [Thauera sp. 27]ENO76579.1 hypothetical protein B447_17586 [Thauera sp. 27]
MTAYLWNLLIALDQFANVLLPPILNLILCPTVARFGHLDETISSVLGKNEESGACVGCRLICRLLHIFDPGHCDKSIERYEGVA